MSRHVPPPDLVSFTSLAGVPVHWGSWGRTGARKLRPAFKALLEAALAEIWVVCPWGAAAGILSGGAYVPRDPPPLPARDRHQEGTAFDLSGIRWTGGPTLLAYDAIEKPNLYLAVEAILRKHIPQSLDWWTNDDHHSHWHLDDREDTLPFNPRHRADVLFVQSALTHVWGSDVVIDGVWGPLSRRAATFALEQISAPETATLEDLPTWHAFLEATALGGFGEAEGG